MKNKILVIEDDRAISELLCMNLEAAGYETVAAYDGEEAQRLLLWQEDADLAVVDIMLPGKDGFALMEDFKKKELPVLRSYSKRSCPAFTSSPVLTSTSFTFRPLSIFTFTVFCGSTTPANRFTAVVSDPVITLTFDTYTIESPVPL